MTSPDTPSGGAPAPRDDAAAGGRRGVRRWTALLFVVALVVRVAAALVFGISGPAVEDEKDYVALAGAAAGGGLTEWLEGHGFWDGPEPLRVRSSVRPYRLRTITHEPRGIVPDALTVAIPLESFRPPGLAIALAPVAASGGGVVAMRVVCLAFGALAAPLAFRALRRTSLGERARWVGLALALWPPHVYLSLRVLTEPLALALLLGALAVRADATDRLVPQWRSALAGALAGLSVLARSSGLVAAALLAFGRGGARRAAAFAAALLLVIAPWVIRNWMLHGRPLLTTNTGVTLVGGNCDAALRAAWPGKWVGPHRAYYGIENPPNFGMFGWSYLSEADSDARFTRDALGWIASHPGDAAVLALWKLVRLFDPDQHSGKEDAGLKRYVGWITFAPVLLLAAWGLFLVRGDPTFRPWLLVLAGTVVTAVVFYGDVRMRSPADPTLLALAAVAAFRIVDRVRGRAAGAVAG